MLKRLTVALALTLSSSVYSQTWITEEVLKEQVVVGYVSRIAAIGTVYSNPLQKAVTNLRLICTVQDKSPLIAIVWDGSDSVGPQFITVEIDGIPTSYEPMRWDQAGKFIFRDQNESTDLFRLMQTGSLVKFSWIDSNDGLKRATTFDISSFNHNLNQFNTFCKI